MALAVCLFGYLYYEGRPRPPKPWDPNAVTAQFEYVATEGDKQNLVFSYTLENRTDFDFRLTEGASVQMNAKLGQEQSLVPFADYGKLDYPIFVPARKRVDFKIHVLGYFYPGHEPKEDTTGSRSDYHSEVAAHVRDKLTNLDGFDLLDESDRKEIVFPAGWKSNKK